MIHADFPIFLTVARSQRVGLLKARPRALALMVSMACVSFGHAQTALSSEPAPAAAPASQQGTTNQATPPAPNAAKKEPAALDSVLITATRRREPMREVPMQVNTLSTQKLDAAGAKNVSDYLANEPGVSVDTGVYGSGSVTIRGVSTGAQPGPTVGMYIDDVAFGSSSAYVAGSNSALDMGLLDLNHIEVLRGPQGTLYGASSMGGLLKYVTNEPDTYALSGKVTLGGSTTKDGGVGSTVAGIVNVPLKEDVAALRVSVFRDKSGGYIDATGPAAGKDVNSRLASGGRLSLLVQPDNQFKLRLTATTQTTKGEGKDVLNYDVATGKPVDADFTKPLSLREPGEQKITILAADVEYDFGWARFNSITSSQRSRLEQAVDFTNIYGPLLGGFGLTVDTVAADYRFKLDKVTQEFRLTSQSRGQFEWLAGFFYTSESGKLNQNVSSTLPGGTTGPVLADAYIPSKYKEAAFYGDVTWKPLPRFATTLGIRVARNSQDFTQNSSGLLTGGAPTSIDGDSRETSKTYLATASYSLTNYSNVYVRAASGYRPGGPNTFVTDLTTGLPIAPPSFAHDSLWSYELGYKADLLDKKISVQAALYDIRWNQIQQFSAVNGISVIVNGGKAEIKGGELAVTYRPSASWDLGGSFAAVDGKLTDAGSGLGAAGSRLPNSARFTGALNARYRFNLGSNPAYVGLDQRYVGERNAGFDGSNTLPNYKLPSYSMTDVQAGLEVKRFQFSLYVRNLLDKRAQLSGDTSAVPLGAPVSVNVARPRTIGLTMSAAF